MKRHILKNYNIFEVRLQDISYYHLYFGFNFEHKFKFGSYVKGSKSFLTKLLSWTKEIESNLYPAVLKYEQNDYESGKVVKKINIIAKRKKKDLLYLDFIDASSNEKMYKAAIKQDVLVRKIKSAIYFELKYNYQYKDRKKDKFVFNLLLDPFLDTLKKANNGVSTIEIQKLDRHNISNYAVFIDGYEVDTQRVVDIGQLIESVCVHKVGSYYFYTCSCGVPDCGGIYEPQIVYRSCPDYIYWDMVAPYGGRFKFEYNQYSNEILKFEDEKMDWDKLVEYKIDESENEKN